MKKFYKISFCLFITALNGQVSIGGKQNVDGASTILDFNNIAGNTNGIILPAVENTLNSLSVSSSANNGTFLFDRNTKKIKVYSNNAWMDITDEGSSSSIIINSSQESTSLQGVIIGSDNSNAKGVLVLESTDKALILSHISNPHLTVKNPYPGMLCYDSASKTIAAFDGIKWNYWK